MNIVESCTVEAVSNKDVKTRYGMKKSYSIKAGGEWFSAGFNNPAVDKGDVIGFNFKETSFGKEIEKGTISVLSKTAMTKPNGKASGHVEFPINPLARERAIIRQNALGHAVEMVVHLSQIDAKASMDDYVSEVIRVARKFEAYAAGDIEREQVEAKSKETK